MADSLGNITDEELQQRLAHFGHTVTTGRLTDAQRQIQKKKLNHLEAKERADKEKAEKAEKEAAKRAIGSPPPKKRAKTAGRRRTVAIPNDVALDENEDKEIGESSVDQELKRSPLKSPVACKEKLLVDPNVPESSPLTVRLTDAGVGRAAVSVPVTLNVLHKTKGWFLLAERRTNVDGECPGLITKDLFQGGLYRIQFSFEEYYKLSNSEIHFPQAEVFIHVEDPGEKYMVSILLMPYGYTSTVVKCN